MRSRSLPTLPLLVTLCTIACGTPRTVVVKVPVPIKVEPCVLYRAPVPGPDVTAGSAAEVAYLARLLSWAAYVDAACGTEARKEWHAP